MSDDLLNMVLCDASGKVVSDPDAETHALPSMVGQEPPRYGSLPEAELDVDHPDYDRSDVAAADREQVTDAALPRLSARDRVAQIASRRNRQHGRPA